MKLYLLIGHCFRRTSATIVANKGANTRRLKKHGGWRSEKTAEKYVVESENFSKETADLINSAFHLSPAPMIDDYFSKTRKRTVL